MTYRNGLKAVVFALAPWLLAQGPALKSFVGTIVALKTETAEVVVKPDNGVPTTAKLTSDTVIQKVAPGETDLKKAQPGKATDMAAGDRVLVTLSSTGADVRRIVVMPASDIARRNAAERADWAKRGVAGIVTAKRGGEVTVRVRSLTGAVDAVVTLDEKTSFKRYAPDSVKFADAKPSDASQINVGDQLRARGQKSADGLKVAAEEVVSGAFVIKAGSITAVHPETKEIAVKDLVTNKPLTIKFAPDSQVKKMPDLSAMMAMMGGAPGGTPPAKPAPGAKPAAGAKPAGNSPQAGAAKALAGFDIAQLLEMMPPAKVEDLKAGETVVVSSTKGATADRITAIMLIGNADMIVQMAAAAGSRGINQLDAAAAAAGMQSGLGGLNMPSMMP